MLAAGLDVGPGDFAENITTPGSGGGQSASLYDPGDGRGAGGGHSDRQGVPSHCAVYHQAGDCVMPREGIFVRVLRGGRVAPGDTVRVRAWGVGRTGWVRALLNEDDGRG